MTDREIKDYVKQELIKAKNTGDIFGHKFTFDSDQGCSIQKSKLDEVIMIKGDDKLRIAYTDETWFHLTLNGKRLSYHGLISENVPAQFRAMFGFITRETLTEDVRQINSLIENMKQQQHITDEQKAENIARLEEKRKAVFTLADELGLTIADTANKAIESLKRLRESGKWNRVYNFAEGMKVEKERQDDMIVVLFWDAHKELIKLFISHENGTFAAFTKRLNEQPQEIWLADLVRMELPEPVRKLLFEVEEITEQVPIQRDYFESELIEQLTEESLAMCRASDKWRRRYDFRGNDAVITQFDNDGIRFIYFDCEGKATVLSIYFIHGSFYAVVNADEFHGDDDDGEITLTLLNSLDKPQAVRDILEGWKKEQQ